MQTFGRLALRAPGYRAVLCKRLLVQPGLILFLSLRLLAIGQAREQSDDAEHCCFQESVESVMHNPESRPDCETGRKRLRPMRRADGQTIRSLDPR